MKIGRKEALIALIAGVIPFLGRRANAQIPREQIREPITMRVQVSPEVADLQKRVAALEAQLANQVGFTRDAMGNLQLRGNRDVTIEAGAGFIAKASTNMQLRASGTMDVTAAATTTVRGSTLSLN